MPSVLAATAAIILCLRLWHIAHLDPTRRNFHFMVAVILVPRIEPHVRPRDGFRDGGFNVRQQRVRIRRFEQQTLDDLRRDRLPIAVVEGQARSPSSYLRGAIT